MTVRPRELPTAVELAYIGDAVWELHVRRQILANGPGTMDDIHRQTVSRVQASEQATVWRGIKEFVTDEELSVARRARNAKLTPPRGVSRADYAQSTSFESVLGYLYWTGQQQRLREVMGRADEVLQREKN